MSLNAKKSWNPGNAANKAKVQKREEDAVALRQRADERRQEVAQERAREAAAAVPVTAAHKVAWMYAEGARPRAAARAPGESLLVGAQRIDDAVLAEKQADARGAREAARKRAADPMAAVLANKGTHSAPARRARTDRVAKSKKRR